MFHEGGSMPFKIVSDNIFNLEVDAIVNPVHQYFFSYMNIHYDHLNPDHRLLNHGIPLTQNTITKSQPHMKADYIIHTVGPRYFKQKHDQNMTLLKQTYTNCLNAALTLQIKSIAFPLISTGGKRFPKTFGIEAATEAIQTFLLTHDLDVYLVIYSAQDFERKQALASRIDEYVQRNFLPDENRVHETLTTGDEFNRIPSKINAYDKEAAEHPLMFNQSFEPEASFQELLIAYINKKHIDTVQLYKKAEISKQHFSKIINQEGYQPKRKTVLLLCVAMELNYDESIDLLESLGYTFSSSNIEDVIVKYFIKTKNYDLYELDETFLSYTSETLRNFD